jgi:hypothetical protein
VADPQFGARLRSLRVAAGYDTARRFAKAVKIGENRYTRYERGASEPDIALLIRICEGLRLSPNELLGYERTKPRPAGGHAPSATGFADGGSPVPRSGPGGAAMPLDSQQRGAGPPGAIGTSSAVAPPDATSLLAWQLADDFVAAVSAKRMGRKRNRDADDPLAAISQIAVVFTQLQKDPLATVARLMTSQELAAAPPSARRRVQATADGLLRRIRQAAAGPRP